MPTETNVPAAVGHNLPPVALPDDADLAALRDLRRQRPEATPEERSALARERGLLRDLEVAFDPGLWPDLLGRSIRGRTVPDLADLVERFEQVAAALGFEPAEEGVEAGAGPSISLYFCHVERLHLVSPTVNWPLEVCHCECRQGAQFHGQTFRAGLDLVGSTFHGPVELSVVTIHGPGRFDATAFRESVELLSVEFRGEATFVGAAFHAGIELGLATTFHARADFGATAVHGFMEVEGAVFRDEVSFRGADLSRPLDLRYAVFEPTCRLSFEELRFGDSALLAGNLRLHCDQLRLGRWPVYRGRLIGEEHDDLRVLEAACEQYGAMEANFAAQSSPDAALARDWCHYRYMDLHRRTTYRGVRLGPLRHLSLWRALDWLFLKWCFGYGVVLKRILLAGAAVMVLFALLYFTHGLGLGGESWAIEDGAGRRLTATGPWYVQLGNALYFSTITFTTVGYGDWHPLGLAKVAGAVEALLGVFIMSVFTVSFARKILR